MNFELRDYQKQAVDKLMWSRRLDGADICVLPTGAGKSLVIAELANRIDSDVLILQPSKEILEQNVEKMRSYVSDDLIGVYSASVGRKDINKYTFATIQSIYKKPEHFRHFNFVIIDECHLVNPKKLDTMFMTFLAEIGSPKVVGMTATPYRMDVTYERTPWGDFIAHTTTKLINRMKGRFWHRIIFNINIEELVELGYLLPLDYKDYGLVSHNEIPTNKSQSDFNLEAFEELIDDKEELILRTVGSAMVDCKHVLVFCSSIEQANDLSKKIPNTAVVTSETSKSMREKIIREFRNGEVRAVFNVGVLTTGFDFPELDGIVLIRPTRSIGLYYQMLGRGVRRAGGKNGCMVYDLSGTVKELGRVETIKLEKQDKWELVSEKGSWHNAILYSFKVEK